MTELNNSSELGPAGALLDHIDTANRQGGTDTESYHTTEDQNDAIENAPTTPDAANPFATVADLGTDVALSNYTETSEAVTFTAGAATVDVSTSENVLTMALTQNSAITVNNPVLNKSVDLVVTHTGGPWTLDWDGTDLELEGAAGETEYVAMRYTGSVWHGFRAGVVDVTI